MPDPANWLARLEADGLLRSDGDRLRTTRRWQSAMARAALRLFSAGDSGEDLRVPIAAALVDLYGNAIDDDALVAAVAALLPIEQLELMPERAVSAIPV